MNYFVRPAGAEDMGQIEEIYSFARAFMAENGNPTQWGTANPARETLEADLERGNLYVVTERETIHGVFAFLLGDDPTYETIYDGAWHSDRPYGTIHRIAGDGSGGIFRTALAFCRERCACLRIDTHRNNQVMQHVIEKAGFRRCGIIYIADGSPRIAYDLVPESSIRKAEARDASRIAEILVFTKRVNFRSIFHNDAYSFGELQVLNVAREYLEHPEALDTVWVYDDGIVKGLIQVEGKEIQKLYVDTFFAGEGIGGWLLEFAVSRFDVRFLWALEKNERALRFYKRHGFSYRGVWQYEEGTAEHLQLLQR